MFVCDMAQVSVMFFLQRKYEPFTNAHPQMQAQIYKNEFNNCKILTQNNKNYELASVLF